MHCRVLITVLRFLIACSLLVGFAEATGNAASTPTGALEAAVRSYAKDYHFNGTLMVASDGQVIFSESFGLADRAFAVPCTIDTKYRIASITKAFTAVLILQLAEQRLIRLEAPIRTYLPDYAGNGAASVTIQELLHHTSGLPNRDAGYNNVDEALKQGMPQYQTKANPADLVARFYSGNLTHAPGTTFDYNNADYILLGRIIEVVTHQSFPAYLRGRLLTPLGMPNSGLLDQASIMPGLAPTYLSKDGTSALDNDPPVYIENWFAAGAMYSTAGDLMRFAQALYAGQLLTPASLQAMLTPGLGGYGDGLWITHPKIGGKTYRKASRPGRIFGANGSFCHFEGVGFTRSIDVVILSNTNSTDLGQLTQLIGNELLRE